MTFNGFTVVFSSTAVTDLDDTDEDGTRTMTSTSLQHKGKGVGTIDRWHRLSTTAGRSRMVAWFTESETCNAKQRETSGLHVSDHAGRGSADVASTYLPTL